MIDIDITDAAILNLLQQNASIGIKELAFRVGLTTTPVYERIKRLEKKGIIKNYTILLDRQKIGVELSVFCNVSLQTHSKSYIEKFEHAISEMPEVVEAHHISGDFDYLLKIVCHDNKQYHDFLVHKLSKLEMVSKVQSNFVMATVKETHFTVNVK